MITDIGVIVLCRNEGYELGKCIKRNSLLKYLLPSNIVVVNSSDDNNNLEIENWICKDFSINSVHKKIGDKNINGIADLRNIGSYSCGKNSKKKVDWILHLDCDELISTRLFVDIDKILSTEKYWAYRFPRINLPFYEQYPDYQTRLIHKEKCIWEGDVHEVVRTLEEPFDHFILKEYPIIHKDVGLKTKIDKNIRWNSNKTNVLVCTLFKDCEKYLDRFLDCLKENIDYLYNSKYNHNSENNPNKNNPNIELELCFLEGNSKDNTWNILKNFRKELNKKEMNINCILEKLNLNDSLGRFEKLSILRNMLIKFGLKNKHDYLFIIDSDIIFEKDTITKLINSIEKNNADVVAPMIFIEKFRTFGNGYFYDILASIDDRGKNFEHYFPYISIDDYDLDNIDNLVNNNKTDKDMNMNNNTERHKIENDVKKIISGEPINMQSVGTCYLAKSELFNLNDLQSFSINKCYKEVEKHNKIICKYDTNDTNGRSEQIGFFENIRKDNKETKVLSAKAEQSKIILDPTIKVLHVNLERIGLTWH